MSLVAYIEFIRRTEFPLSLDNAKLLLSLTSIAITQAVPIRFDTLHRKSGVV
jgi:hypothetical protein